MTDNPALLAACAASPADDLPRLVYADWLEEHGQTERAEFIRVQIAFVRSPSDAPERHRLAALQTALLQNWVTLLEAADVPLFEQVSFRPVFSRGFLSEVVFPILRWEPVPTPADRVNRVAGDWHRLCDLLARSPLVWKVECPHWFYLLLVPVATGGWVAKRILHPPPRCETCGGRGYLAKIAPEQCVDCVGLGHRNAEHDFVPAGTRFELADQVLRNAVACDLFGGNHPSYRR